MDDTDDPARPGASSDLDIWEGLLETQTSLFRKTVARNKSLEQQLTELQTEVGVWKLAHNAAKAENETLKKSVQRLERSIGSIKDENPLILCVIDGDGNIFSSDLITQGHAGGRRAAMLLTQGLTEHMASMDTDGDAPLGRGEIWLTIYCNKKGLTEALASNNVCTAEQFEQFVMGFNQAAPLFSIVDVGVGKEAADSKIKECLRVFTRFPQTSRVFFGGAHDNGYTSTLNYLQNEGLFNKLVILRGYKELAPELRSLNLPYLDIEGLFLQEKLITHPYKKGSVANNGNKPNVVNSNVGGQAPNVEKPYTKGVNLNKAPQSSTLGKNAQSRPLAPNVPLNKQKPAPCNFHYLTGSCKWAGQCIYAHDYPLTPAQVQELRRNAKNWPCPYINRGHPCPLGEECCMAHKCPKGAKCNWAKVGTCKFTGKGMHPVKKGKGSPSSTSVSGGATSPTPSTRTSLSPAASPFMSEAELPSAPGIGWKPPPSGLSS